MTSIFTRIPLASGFVVCVVAASGCGADGTIREASSLPELRVAAPDSNLSDPDSEPLAPVGILASETESGTSVTVSFTPDPPSAGLVTMTIDLDPAPSDPEAVTVDLVSPEMLTHGVMRYPTRAGNGPGRFTSEVPVPMAGLWEFYVNLDVGLDAAVFSARVGPGDGGMDPAHDADHGSPPTHDHGGHAPPGGGETSPS